MKRFISIHGSQNKLINRFRESGKTAADLDALREVQGQFDSLIRQMLEAELMPAGLAAGGDNACAEFNTYTSRGKRQEYETAE
jgi:hypothetical protein